MHVATPARRRPRSLLDISNRSSRSRLLSGTCSSRSRLPSGTCSSRSCLPTGTFSSRSRLPSGTCMSRRTELPLPPRRTQPGAQQRLRRLPTTQRWPDFFTLSTLPAFSAKRTCASYLHPAKGLAPNRNSLIPFPAITKAREEVKQYLLNARFSLTCLDKVRNRGHSRLQGCCSEERSTLVVSRRASR